ncbi:MAG: YCF48-related protein [Bacteroidia bacterium]|jgi:photosystem II stability/assembly factor-like uncharacterized protein|nr:YCF48-related protein [Bacteroidia bacterium]
MKFTCILLLLLPVFCIAQQVTWQKLNTQSYPGKQDDIYFVDEQNGWYVNGYGRIYRTRNAGQSWELQLEQKGTFFRCIAFIDTLTGFAGTVGTEYFPNVTDTIPLYKTTNGGLTWQPVSYMGNYVKGLCAIDIVKELYINHGVADYKYHVYAVGRVGGPANILVSHDNGNTFTSMEMNAYGTMLFDIDMFNTTEGIACSASDVDVSKSHARLLRTTDGGKTWKTVYQSKRHYELTWKCFFPSSKVGYATVQSYNPDTTISQQIVLKTTDGGKSWKEFKLVNNHKARPFGIGFVNEQQGYVGTLTSGYETNDGGRNWQPIDLGKACNKIRIVHKPDGSVYGYAIGVSVYKLVVN